MSNEENEGPTPEQIAKMDKLSKKIVEVMRLDTLENNPDGKMGLEDIKLMVATLQAVTKGVIMTTMNIASGKDTEAEKNTTNH